MEIDCITVRLDGYPRLELVAEGRREPFVSDPFLRSLIEVGGLLIHIVGGDIKDFLVFTVQNEDLEIPAQTVRPYKRARSLLL